MRCCVPETVALGVVLVVVTAAQAQNPLKYHFAAGQQFVYEHHASVTPLDANEPLRRSTGQVQIWCLQRGAGEALLLVDVARSEDGRTQPAAGALLYVDEVGRRRLPEEIPSRLSPLDPVLDLLPMLPPAGQGDAAWATPPDHYQRQWRCVSRGPDASHAGHLRIEFTLEDPLGVSDFLGQSRRGRFWFDPAGGCVTRFEADETDRHRQTRTEVAAALRQTLTHGPAWAARRADEADRFLRTLRHDDRLLREIVKSAAELPHTLQQLDQLWSAFKSDVEARSGSPFLRLADARRQQLRADADLFRTRATLGLRWLNQPARPFSLQNPAGRTVTSEAARQDVVIECFWSADSVWGLRVLESLRRLQTDPGPDPVRVLCFNMDSDIDLARRAIRRCGRGLTHILGGPLQDVEGLPEFPVLRVVDRAGIIRDIWLGWQPDYPAARDLAHRLAEDTPGWP